MNERERPTTPSQGDMSHGVPRTSVARAAISEGDLLRGYGVVRVERCVCGGEIVAAPGDPITCVVAIHNLSTEHVAWRVMR